MARQVLLGEELVDPFEHPDVILLFKRVIVEQAAVLATRYGFAVRELSGRTEMQSCVISDISHVAEQPEENGPALQVGPSVGDEPSAMRSVEDDRAHQKGNVGWDFP